MHPDEEPTARRPETSIDLRFAALVATLRAEDPLFVRRCSAPARWLPTRVDALIVVGMIATLLLGIVPLGLGVALQALPLLAVGAVASLVMPIAAPLLVRRAIVRHRPLWV